MKIYQKIFARIFLYANINSITIPNPGKENTHYGNQEKSRQEENSQKKISTLSILFKIKPFEEIRRVLFFGLL